MDYQDMGRKIHDLRKERGITQERLAEQLGISASFLGHIERGTRAASLETLVILCRELRISPEYLLEASLSDIVLSIPVDLTEKQRRHLKEIVGLVIRQMRE